VLPRCTSTVPQSEIRRRLTANSPVTKGQRVAKRSTKIACARIPWQRVGPWKRLTGGGYRNDASRRPEGRNTLIVNCRRTMTDRNMGTNPFKARRHPARRQRRQLPERSPGTPTRELRVGVTACLPVTNATPDTSVPPASTLPLLRQARGLQITGVPPQHLYPRISQCAPVCHASMGERISMRSRRPKAPAAEFAPAGRPPGTGPVELRRDSVFCREGEYWTIGLRGHGRPVTRHQGAALPRPPAAPPW